MLHVVPQEVARVEVVVVHHVRLQQDSVDDASRNERQHEKAKKKRDVDDGEKIIEKKGKLGDHELDSANSSIAGIFFAAWLKMS